MPTTQRVVESRPGAPGRRVRAAVRPGPGPDRHRRRLVGQGLRDDPLDRSQGRRAAAEPHRAAGLRLQLVRGGRRQRVPQRLRGAPLRSPPDGAGHGGEGARRHRRHRVWRRR
ncbi:hypothetical protein G5V59_11740 [Nocardioides sp. W3-2-3]|uniref:hypothetical protein n=1 Tax=Nocardioides convexus TaxID=2712224 RepID=UPI00241816F9|nr:hypothetical protein [Nocardioides convexus]NHA00475.1 hypothetical protein [Nocardioides convexus]